MPDDLAARLRTKRHQEGYSLRTLGQTLGVSKSFQFRNPLASAMGRRNWLAYGQQLFPLAQT
jgi:hypothetical protein